LNQAAIRKKVPVAHFNTEAIWLGNRFDGLFWLSEESAPSDDRQPPNQELINN
jgi:hypothetical protein